MEGPRGDNEGEEDEDLYNLELPPDTNTWKMNMSELEMAAVVAANQFENGDLLSNSDSESPNPQGQMDEVPGEQHDSEDNNQVESLKTPTMFVMGFFSVFLLSAVALAVTAEITSSATIDLSGDGPGPANVSLGVNDGESWNLSSESESQLVTEWVDS